ncbi:HNH endonuclease [Massilia antarctica]|uniref:HNH endonuclease n=1 Tax=Massilia antarctica TaxID=2765360 RepID=A0AA48W9R7_9BURK|nr:HNH endonuclease [Massilia antarctica]
MGSCTSSQDARRAHLHQDTGRMQLPPTEIHGAVKHIGWESLSERR